MVKVQTSKGKITFFMKNFLENIRDKYFEKRSSIKQKTVNPPKKFSDFTGNIFQNAPTLDMA